mmetsp:Transcript_124949/g.358735  ORF Transcript_124949/g.358735 Transcript_124949/m.358735 type:complete len:294 (+) Transcript_124949:102-983(+)
MSAQSDAAADESPRAGAVQWESSGASVGGGPLPKVHYAVPQSVYGTVIFMPVLVHVASPSEWLRWHGLSYFWMCVNLATQVLFLVGLAVVIEQRIEEMDPTTCVPLLPGILAPSLFACLVASFTDIEETIDIGFFVLYRMATTDSTSMIDISEGSPGTWDMQAGGFSLARKAFIAVFILIPKLALAIGLLIYSFWFLMVSPNNMEIILNAVAFVFILQVDEALFGFFSLPEVRSLMDSLPPFEEDGESKTAWLRPLWQLLKLVVGAVMIAAAIVTYGWCGNEGSSYVLFGYGL